MLLFQNLAQWSQRKRAFNLFSMVLALLIFSGISQCANAQSTSAAEVRKEESSLAGAVVSVESATYRARLNGLEMTDGELELEVVRRGTGPGLLNWTDVTLAISKLKWKHQPLLSGTTAKQQMVVIVDRDSDQLTGQWSSHGKKISQKSVFDLTFPPALNTTLKLQLPSDLLMEASQGVLREPPLVAGEESREWVLELGNLSSTTLKVAPTVEFRRTTPLRYEIETEHRTRRDGIVLKADLTVDGSVPAEAPLEIQVSDDVEIQSITLFSGSSQTSASLNFLRDPKRPRVVSVLFENLRPDSRFTLRIRAFQAVVWGEKHVLPKFQIEEAQETRRTVVMRVEPPLQLQSVETLGMIQTGLSSEEITGEVWKYEATELDCHVDVLIALPRSGIVANMDLLADAQRSSGWVACVLTMHVENGTRFQSTMQLPDEWKLVSVSPGNTESRMASWTMDAQTLHVVWQNPITSTSRRQLRLFARTSAWKSETPLRLPIPQIELADDVSVLYQLLIPNNSELQVIEGEGWRVSDGNEISPALIHLREVTDRIPDPSSIQCTNLRSSGDPRSARTLVKMVPRSSTVESVTTQGLIEPTRSHSPSVVEAPPHSLAPPVLVLQVFSIAGPSLQSGCVHHANLHFDRAIPVSELKLKLPTSCRVSAVAINNHSVTVFRKGEEIPIPADMTSVSSIQLTYATEAVQDSLYQVNNVPLPQTGLTVTSFDWTLELPREQRLSGVSLPGVLKESEQDRHLTRQFFGPLSRRETEPMFNPLAKQDWTKLLKSASETPARESPRRALQFIAPTVGESAQFVTWNSSVVRSYAWIALLGCLMIGSASRLFRIGWIRQISVVWLIILFACASIMPAPWATILGGMFAGSLLSMLIPRSWMQKRDFLARAPRNLPAGRELVSAGALLLCASLLWAQPVSREPSPSESSGRQPVDVKTDLPVYLIQSAHYEMLAPKPSPLFRATFEVLAQTTSEDLFIRLPFQDVVFSSSAECLVNGQSQPLIPSLSGDAMVVNLNESKSDSQSDSQSSDKDEKGVAPKTDVPAGWSSFQIQLDFAIRIPVSGDSSAENLTSPMPEETNSGPATFGSFQASIPIVLDSTLSLPKNSSLPEIQRWGHSVAGQQGQNVLQMGGIGKLQSDASDSNSLKFGSPRAITVLEVSPLRIKGQTRLLAGAEGWPHELPLTFPSGCVITGIVGSSLIDSLDAPSREEGTSLTLRLRPGSPASPVTINFELTGHQRSSSELRIPAFPLWGGVKVPHTIGLTGPPTSLLTLVNTAGIVSLSAEEWPSQSDLGRSRPALAVFLNSPRSLTLDWTKLTPMRTAAVMETLIIEREEVAWTATVRMNVAQIPTFRHRFRLDPAVRVESVVAIENGNRKTVRSTRTGEFVTLFLPGGQLGDRTFVLSGRYPLTVDAWSSIPLLEPIEANVTDSQLKIEDRTNWSIDLESSPGVPVPFTPKVLESDGDEVKTRLLGTFRRDASVRLTRLRVAIPPQATRADSILLLKQNRPDNWEMVTTFHLTALESGLKKAVFRVPAEYSTIRIQPSNFHHTDVVDANGTTVSVHIPERYSSSATITIASQLTPELQRELMEKRDTVTAHSSIPTINVLSAQKASQFVLIEPTSPIVPAPTGSLQIESDEFPSWAPPEWIRKVQEHQLVCYQQIRRDLAFVQKSTAEINGLPVVRLDETVIWPLKKGEICGVSRIWLATKKADVFQIIHSSEVDIDTMMTVEQGPITWKSIDQGTEISLPPRVSHLGLIVHWKRKNAGGLVRPLQFGKVQPERQLIAVTQPDHWDLQPGTAASVNLLETWLVRWDALLQCLNDLSGPVPVDSVLLNNIRMCQKEASGLLRSPGSPATASQREEFKRLVGLWTDLKENLVISGIPNSDPQDPFVNAFTMLLEQRNPGLRIDWLIPSSPDWTGHLEPGTSSQVSWKVVLGSCLSLLGIGLIWRFSSWLRSIRELFAGHPAWSLMILGLIWWVWLAPSFVGLLIILLSWGFGTAHWLITKVFSRRSKVPANS